MLKLILAIVLCVAWGCASSQHEGTQSAFLASLAQKAKLDGKTAISTSFIPERDTDSTLEDVRRNVSFVLASPTGAARVGVFNRIMTAQDFHVERWLQRLPAKCTEQWPGATEDPSLLTLRLFKGTVVVDGIAITEETAKEIDFLPGNRYLLLAQDCGHRRVELSYWWNSIFVVSNDDQIGVPAFNLPMVPFVNEIANLKTISALEQTLSRKD